jgi:membrane-associated protease RseP (regulator of RpoE activity)
MVEREMRFYIQSKDMALPASFNHGKIKHRYELEIKKKQKERVWINLLLLAATFISTTVMGMGFYGEFNVAGGVLFSLAIMFVLGSHEMGHYAVARGWGMKTTLPYFIPFPTFIGTLGALIKHKGPIPNRKALFDVGVSGPIVGIAASIIVGCIGLSLPFHPKIAEGEMFIIGTPPLFDALIALTGFKGTFFHPVAIAGWVGMFVTFLNLIPVGQLDGGHVLRAMIGKNAEVVSKTMPLVLIAVGSLVEMIYHVSSSIWIFWGLITLFFSMQHHPKPIDDVTPICRKRVALGLSMFAVALLCFTPVPISVQK